MPDHTDKISGLQVLKHPIAYFFYGIMWLVNGYLMINFSHGFDFLPPLFRLFISASEFLVGYILVVGNYDVVVNLMKGSKKEIFA